jgi:hypothetical protein
MWGIKFHTFLTWVAYWWSMSGQLQAPWEHISAPLNTTLGELQERGHVITRTNSVLPGNRTTVIKLVPVTVLTRVQQLFSGL